MGWLAKLLRRSTDTTAGPAPAASPTKGPNEPARAPTRPRVAPGHVPPLGVPVAPGIVVSKRQQTRALPEPSTAPPMPSTRPPRLPRWTPIALPGAVTVTRTSEVLDGALYLTCTEFDSDGKIMRKILTRSDVVRKSLNGDDDD